MDKNRQDLKRFDKNNYLHTKCLVEPFWQCKYQFMTKYDVNRKKVD